MSKINDLIKKMCPNGVEHKQLNEIADTFIGLATSVTKHKTSDGVILLHNSDIKQNKIVLKTIEFIDKGFADKNVNKYYQYHDIATVHTGDVGTSAVIEEEYVGSMGFTTLVTRIYDFNYINPYYLCHYFNSQLFKNAVARVTISDRSNLNQKKFCQLLIPIPPLEVQNEIVRILDKFGELEAELEAELEVRKNQYEFWRGNIFGSIEGRKVKLGDLLDYIQPTKYIVSSTEYSDEYKTPVLTAGQTFILGYTNENDGIYKASNNKPVIIFDDFTTSNHWVDFDFKVKSSAMKMLVPKTNDNFRYIYHAIKNIKYEAKEHSRQWIQNFSNFDIVLPNIEKQNKIVDILDKFDTLVSDMSIGLPAEIELRRKQYEYYRNKLLSFEELSVSE